LSSPPPPTFIPYTTLFRSSLEYEGVLGWSLEDLFLDPVVPFLLKFQGKVWSTGFDYAAFHEYVHMVRLDVSQDPLVVRDYHNTQDRKSTRLNSSHQIISYA